HVIDAARGHALQHRTNLRVRCRAVAGDAEYRAHCLPGCWRRWGSATVSTLPTGPITPYPAGAARRHRRSVVREGAGSAGVLQCAMECEPADRVEHGDEQAQHAEIRQHAAE